MQELLHLLDCYSNRCRNRGYINECRHGMPGLVIVGNSKLVPLCGECLVEMAMEMKGEHDES